MIKLLKFAEYQLITLKIDNGKEIHMLVLLSF